MCIHWLGRIWIAYRLFVMRCKRSIQIEISKRKSRMRFAVAVEWIIYGSCQETHTILCHQCTNHVLLLKHTRIITSWLHSNGNPTPPDWNVSFWNLNAIRLIVIWLLHCSSSELFRLAAASAAVVFYWAGPLFTLIWSDQIEAEIFAMENEFWLRNDIVDDWSFRMQHVPNISHHKRI